MLKAVIFDMDGVIVNSEPLHHLAYKKMFEEFQLDVSNSLYESFTGQSTHTICKQLCEIFNIYEDPNLLVQSKRKHFKVIFDNFLCCKHPFCQEKRLEYSLGTPP